MADQAADAPATGAEAAADTAATDAATAVVDSSTATDAGATGQVEGTSAVTADEKPADKSTEAQGAPEAYEAFAMPDGVEIHPEVSTDLTALAKELNLTQAQAQKVADLGVKQSQRFADAQAQALTKAREGWVSEIKADKDFGGDNLNTTLAAGKATLEQFGTPALRGLLDESGLGDHPEVIRFFAKVGKATGNDKIVTGQPATGLQGDAAKAAKLFPTMAQG